MYKFTMSIKEGRYEDGIFKVDKRADSLGDPETNGQLA